MRTFLTAMTLAIVTPYYIMRFMIAEYLGIGNRDGTLMTRAPNVWGRLVCRAAGTTIETHGLERLLDGNPRVLVVNHVSWFDVFTLASVLPNARFIAKAEMRRIPVFGRAMSMAGMLFVDRDNRKAAFAAYDDAAVQIRNGKTVVIFPEGTRGKSYALRPFKKGPFVLAITAGVPIVPILLHGTRDVLPRGSVRVRRRTVQIHALGEIPTAGCTYEDRNRLAVEAYTAMATAQRMLYGVESPEWKPIRTTSAQVTSLQ